MNRAFIEASGQGLGEPSHPRCVISRERLAQLQERNDRAGLRQLAAHSALLALSVLAVLFAPAGWPLAMALGACAIVQFGMFGMLHESAHQTAFKTRGWNLAAGWVAALSQPMSPALMRAFHFEHHRHTHQLERDPELAQLAFMQRWPHPILSLVMLSGVPLVMARFVWTLFAALMPRNLAAPLWEKVLPFVRPAKRSRVVWEARLLMLVHAAIVAVGVLFAHRVLYFYLAMVIGHGLLSLYIACEHRGLSPEGNILERTRSLEVPAPLRWLLWNMPHHAEHHAWPAVPFFALPALHRELRERLPHLESPVYLHLHAGQAKRRLP